MNDKLDLIIDMLREIKAELGSIEEIAARRRCAADFAQYVRMKGSNDAPENVSHEKVLG